LAWLRAVSGSNIFAVKISYLFGLGTKPSGEGSTVTALT